MQDGKEGAIPWLRNRVKQQNASPFFLVVSLVNPHDLAVYCGDWENSTYPDAMLEGSMTSLPPTWLENKRASFKPQVNHLGLHTHTNNI